MKNEPQTISGKKKAKTKTTIQKSRTTTKKLRDNSQPVKRITSTTKQQTLHASFSVFDVNRLDLKPLLHIQVLERLGIDYTTDKDFNQSVLDLYNCIPGPVNINNFLPGATTGFVVNWIVNHFQTKPGTEFIINQGEKCITEYDVILCSDNGACIPVGYLEDIVKLDKEFHDALLFVFQYIYNHTHCEFMCIDDEFGLMDFIDEIREDSGWPEEDQEQCKQEMEQYVDGIVTQYYRMINEPLKKVTNKKLNEILNHLERIPALKIWFNKLIHFFNTDGSYNVHQFDFNYADPEGNDGTPIYYSQSVGFYWKQDFVFHEIDEILNQVANEVGIIEPSWSKTYTTDGIRGEIKDNQWPALFKNLMSEFNNIIVEQILKHYGLSAKKY